MPKETQKPLAELTVSDVTQAYDDAFDAPEPKAKPNQQPATPPAEKPAAAISDPAEVGPAPEEKPAKRRRADGTFMPSHSAYWLRKAQEAGLGDAEIDSMEPDELRQAVQVEIQSKSSAVRETNSVQPVKETPAPKPSIEINDDDYDTNLGSVLKAIVARLDAVEGREVARQQRGMANALDRLFDAQKDIFGAGATAKLKEGSPEAIRRTLVMQGLNMLAQSGQKTSLDADFAKIASAFGVAAPKSKGGDAPPDDDEHLWDKPARGGREPSEQPATPRNRLTREKEWEEGTVEPPTHRAKPVLPKGPAKAKQTFVNGMAAIEEKRTASGETDENDELPG